MLTRYLGIFCAGLNDYYMGYYIHNCPKMKYKGSFAPSFLLDVSAKKWVPLDDRLKTDLTENERLLAKSYDYNELPTKIDNVKISLHFGVQKKIFLFKVTLDSCFLYYS